MSVVGVKIDQFDVPVCNSFQARILNDQLCYEVDLNEFSNTENIDKQLKLGFSFFMDYNEDRHIDFIEERNENKKISLTSSIAENTYSKHASIYLNTISRGSCPFIHM